MRGSQAARPHRARTSALVIAEYRGDPVEEPGLLARHALELARVQPGAVAVEAAIDLDVLEDDLLELHPAVGASHPVELLQPRVLLGFEGARLLHRRALDARRFL